MKKFLLSAGLFSLVLVGRAQTVLNELYAEPGSGNSEFIELYNSAAGAVNVDCYSILVYWSEGANKGWYVLDLPNDNVVSKGFYVAAAASPFNTQNTTGSTANVNWNDATFRSGATSGYLKKYQQSGGSYTEVDISAVSVTDLIGQGNFYTGQNYMVLVFVNGVFTNGFWGGGPTGTLPVGITGMNDLSVTPSGAGCGGAFNVDFSTLGAVEFVNQSPGANNGYARLSDGKCGAWAKTAPQVQHTPGVTNGSAAGASGALTTAEFISCQVPPVERYVSFDVTAITGDVNETDDFPIEVSVYDDVNHNGTLDGADQLINPISKDLATVAGSGDTVQLTGSHKNADVIVVYKTQRGCFDRVVRIISECAPLPVNFKSFTAIRTSGTMVELKWVTITEEFSKGFIVERNTGTGWVEVVFIPSQAVNGNSTDQLTYHYSDLNSAKGISQYRIRQVDIDNTSRLSQIRAVRGEGQAIKTNVFPNPTHDGKVTVVFVDGNATRDITLMDMSGRVVAQMKGVTNNNIQLENLNPGMYSLRIVDRGTGMQAVEKIVVNKR